MKSEDAKDVLLRLLAVTKGNDFQLSPQMLEEIEAISIHGADPEWQTQELKRFSTGGQPNIDFNNELAATAVEH